MHRFLYFDLGNVLLDFDHEVGCARVASLCGVTPHRVREVVFDSGLEWQYERGDLNSQEFYQAIRVEIPTVPTPEVLLRQISDIFQVKPHIESLLDRLTARKFRMGILSNTCEAHWTHVFSDRFPFLTQQFEVHALSFRLRSMKPEPAIYRRALELSGASGAEVFFVDDRMENVRGAVEAGIDAVHFVDVPKLECDLRARGLLD